MTIGWDLGGGGSRGIFQFGMIKRCWEEGLHPDIIMGTSIGSLNGAGVAMGDLEKVEHMWLTVTNKQVYSLAPWQLFMPGKGALYDFKPMRKILDRLIDRETLRRSKMKLWVTVTSLRNNCAMRYRLTGEGCHPDPVNILQSQLFASGAGRSEPFKGEFYDGGISDNFNVGATIAEGANHIIMMHPSRPALMKINNALDALDAMVSISMWSIYKREIDGLNAMPEDKRPKPTVIQPTSSIHFPMWNFDYKGHDRRKLIKMGYELAARAIG